MLLALVSGFIVIFGPTMMDFIANKIMFNHGLEFSWDWFIPWGIALNLTVIGSSTSNALIYWAGRKLTLRRRVTAILIWMTGYWQIVSANEDMIWFIVFDGGFPPLDQVWWWMPQHWVVQWLNPAWEWTTLCMALWCIVMNLILVGLWVYWFVYYYRDKAIQNGTFGKSEIDQALVCQNFTTKGRVKDADDY